MDNAVTRLEGGLATLESAAADTKVLSEELAVQNADIAEKKAGVEIIIDYYMKMKMAVMAVISSVTSSKRCREKRSKSKMKSTIA